MQQAFIGIALHKVSFSGNRPYHLEAVMLSNHNSNAPGERPSKANPHNKTAIPNLSKFSLHSLRVELHRRNIPSNGLREELETRLEASLQNIPITVPTAFPVSALPYHFPLAQAGGEEIVKVEGVLKNRTVWIGGDEQMAIFWARGNCGKANLSRSGPVYNQIQDDNLQGRAMRQLVELEGNSAQSRRANVEHLQLTLVEAYYASFVEKRLVVINGGELLHDAGQTWRLFAKRCHRFAWMFVAYCRYRSAGWLPRSGLKYGVDWVLYPSAIKKHSHSPYCVVLSFSPEGEAKCDKSWIGLQNRLRLVKNVAKTLVLAEVYLDHPADIKASIRHAFGAVRINELTIDRWIP